MWFCLDSRQWKCPVPRAVWVCLLSPCPGCEIHRWNVVFWLTSHGSMFTHLLERNPAKNIDLDRASASQTAWRANRLTSYFWVYAGVRGKIRFIPKGNINCIWLVSAVSDASEDYITECFYVQLHLSNTGACLQFSKGEHWNKLKNLH